MSKKIEDGGKEVSKVEIINKEIAREVKNEDVQRALLATTFKGFDMKLARQAMLEGMLRGFSFQDFLHKNVYAIPFGKTYSLITSIDYSRKLAMRSGLVGKSAPSYTYDADGKLKTCTVTIKRKVENYVGEYTATVDFDEYTTGRNLWLSKPKTMLAKVAEMHALRSAFPEEMAKQYIEEEMERDQNGPVVVINTDKYEEELRATKTEDELRKVWASLPLAAKKELEGIKKELKSKYENTKVQDKGGVADGEAR